MRLIIDPWSGLVHPIVVDPGGYANVHNNLNKNLPLDYFTNDLTAFLNKNSVFLDKKYEWLNYLIKKEKIIEKELEYLKNIHSKLQISLKRDPELSGRLFYDELEKYKISLIAGEENFSSDFEIKSNPNYKITSEEYSEFDKYASHMENQFSEMANYVNKNKKLLDRLSDVIKRIDNSKSNLINQGLDLHKKMQEWDEKMMQRKSLAYDDVENFPNKFIADYLFIIDEMKGDIPILTNGVINSMKRLDEKWMSLKDEIVQILNQDLKNYNKELWANGIGAVN